MAAPLARYGEIPIFSDSDIAASDAWKSTIQGVLDKSKVAVLLVSRYFLESAFIRETELPYILKAREERGLSVLWVLVSDCLYTHSPLATIQAALSTNTPLEAMTAPELSRALKSLCEQMETESERPRLNTKLNRTKVQQTMNDFEILMSPAARRTEIFVRGDGGAWYHQGAIFPGHTALTCFFGNARTHSDTKFTILAMTTDEPVPNQRGKQTSPLPKARTRAEVRVARA